MPEAKYNVGHVNVPFRLKY